MAKKQEVRLAAAQGMAQPWYKRMPTWAWFVLVGVGAAALVLGLFYLDAQSLRGGVNVTRGIRGAKVLSDPGAGHLEGEIDYPVPVPAGGPHNPVWQNCGIYDEPVRAENAVHSLEHGAVWITYDPALPEEQVEELRNLVRQERARLRTFYILSPHPDLPAPIVATAWRAQLELEDAFDDRLLTFMQRFHIGPFTPERGATCSGGDGEPIP